MLTFNLKSLYNYYQQLNESVTVNGISPEKKDIDRINNIIKRAKSDKESMIKLTHAMIKSIKDDTKLMRRYLAAVEVAGDNNPVTIEFKKACEEKGLISNDSNNNNVNPTVNNEITNPESTEVTTPDVIDTNDVEFDDTKEHVKEVKKKYVLPVDVKGIKNTTTTDITNNVLGSIRSIKGAKRKLVNDIIDILERKDYKYVEKDI